MLTCSKPNIPDNEYNNSGTIVVPSYTLLPPIKLAFIGFCKIIPGTGGVDTI